MLVEFLNDMQLLANNTLFLCYLNNLFFDKPFAMLNVERVYN